MLSYLKSILDTKLNKYKVFKSIGTGKINM